MRITIKYTIGAPTPKCADALEAISQVWKYPVIGEVSISKNDLIISIIPLMIVSITSFT
jgi:hypothetical protein